MGLRSRHVVVGGDHRVVHLVQDLPLLQVRVRSHRSTTHIDVEPPIIIVLAVVYCYPQHVTLVMFGSVVLGCDLNTPALLQEEF